MPTDEETRRTDHCRDIAAQLLGYMPRFAGRRDVFVTVVVHEREGDAHALVASCVTAPELARLSRVLGESANEAAALAVEAAEQRSPWGG